MKKESGRPILLKGKKIFAGAAIATLLVQPLYIPLSSGVAFAATDKDNSFIILNEAASASVTVAGNQDENEAYTGKPSITGLVDRLNPESNYEYTHSFTITIPDNTFEEKSYTTNSASHTFTLDTFEYGDGNYTIEYTASYGNISEGPEQADATTTPPVEEQITVTTIPTANISEDISVEQTSYHFVINATPGTKGEKITKITASIYNRPDDSIVREPVTVDGGNLTESNGVWSATFEFDELNPGDYYVLYSAESTNPGGETSKTTGDLRKEFSIPQETTTPEEPADPTDPQNPEEPQNPAPVDPDSPEDPEYETPANEGPEIAPEDPEALPEEAEGDDESPEDDEDITETALGVASFSTGLVGSADPFFTEIIGGRTIPVDNGNDSSNEEENNIKAPTAGDVINKNETDEKGVAKFLGIAWYWWVAMIAGATSLWSLVIAGRNRMTGGDL